MTPTSTIAHKGEVAGAKVLAATIVDLMTSPEVLKAAHAEWEQATRESPYFSLIPADAQPDINMNRDAMATFRPAMTKFYLNKSPRFQ